MAEQKYTIGDIVTIKKLTRDDGEYRFGLNSEMMEASGRAFTIKSIELTTASPGKIPDDGYRYKLEGSPWSWASSMFEDPPEKTSKALITQCVSAAKDSSIDAFIKKNECPILDFTL